MKEYYNLGAIVSVMAVTPSFIPDALRVAADAIERGDGRPFLDLPEYRVRIASPAVVSDLSSAASDIVEYFSDRLNEPVPAAVQSALYKIRLAIDEIEVEA